MTEVEKVPKCWGCGKIQAVCDYEDGFTPLLVNSPKEIIPICGGTIYIDKEPWADPKKYNELLPRPCCVCGEEWISTHHEHLYGVCPHCGAHGADGIGGKIK